MKQTVIETAAQFEEWCKQHKYSKTEIARILGITRQTLYNLTALRSKAPAYQMTSPKVAENLTCYGSLPPMLSLSLFAIEKLGPEFFGESKRLRKPYKRKA